jgi:hypothetical protein
VVIDKINIIGIAFLESEDDAPVRPDGYAPKALEITFQGVEVETGKVHVFRLTGTVQDSHDVLDFLEVIGADAFGFPILEEPFEALMPEALNHGTSYR